MVWEPNLAHPASRRWRRVPIEALLFFRDGASERVVRREVFFQTAVPADAPDTFPMDFFGWEDDYYYDWAGSTTRR